MTNERSGNPRPLKGSGDTERSGNPRRLRPPPEREPGGPLERFGVDPNAAADGKNWQALCRTVWALINNPHLIVGRDNSRIIFPPPVVARARGAGGASSESSLSSESSSESSSSVASSESSAGSSGPLSESDKSTAIVPAPWSQSGFTALFCLESPEVRFDDVVTFALYRRVEKLPLDPRFAAVCEPGSLRVCGFSVDQPVMVGILPPVDGFVWTRLSWPLFGKPEWPVRVTMRITGIRRGFAGKRFPARTREQFEANEAFINSAYPGTPSPPQP